MPFDIHDRLLDDEGYVDKDALVMRQNPHEPPSMRVISFRACSTTWSMSKSTMAKAAAVSVAPAGSACISTRLSAAGLWQSGFCSLLQDP